MTFRKLLLYVHLRKKVAFETSCVCSVVYDFKTMENIPLVTSDVLYIYNDGKQMYIETILSKLYTDKWIGFIWLLIG